MDIREVIDYIKDKYKYCGNDCNGLYVEECKEAKEMAISALEKQIEKKPVYIGPWFECGNCKKRIGIPNYTINLDVHNYCHHCGQRIDWSEI